MAIEKRDIEIIDAHIRGELDEQGLKALRKRREDPEFADLMDEMLETRRAISAEGRKELREEMRNWDKSAKVRRLVRVRTVIGVAASILILVVAYFVFRPTADLEAIAESYLDPYPNVVAPIQKSGGDELTPFERAFQLYEMGYYNKAEDQFGILDQDNESVQFYAGVTALLDQDAELAQERLGAIVQDPRHRYHTPAQWYCALAYLLEDEKSDAVILLERVAESNSPLSKRARMLLDEIL
jgi:hypothetical protein